MKCRVCGDPVKTVNAKTCSKKCMGKWNHSHMVKDKNPAWRGGAVTHKCAVCGNTFTSTRNRINAKFCSNKCRAIWYSGDRNKFWKGTQPLIYKIRCSKKYAKWRKEVFSRDGEKCVNCGEHNNLHAHHIKHFSVLINDLKQKYPLIINYQLVKEVSNVWDVGNGITLCGSCHKIEHSK